MIKYIIKRLLISVLVLFGVSIIIYTMVRLMPNNYVDIKFVHCVVRKPIGKGDR